MAANLVIGLIYLRDKNWIGGTYYIENIIHALNGLAPELKPSLRIYCYSKDEFNELKRKTGYLSMEPAYIIHTNLVARIINKVALQLLGRHILIPKLNSAVDVLFPASDGFQFRNFKNKVYWIPDFQELHYPKFFKSEEIESRKKNHLNIIKSNGPIVLSSENAKADFQREYPRAKTPTFVIPFAVTIPITTGINLDSLKKKYGITGDYFISSNQFWAHKNHQVVIRAIQLLKKKNSDVTLLFTGKPYDNRNPDYYKELLTYVTENNLEERVRFLGFIDRNDQIELMKNSVAIIQPSLFEGWSTVVEDAKALNHSIIVSDIPVHREQLGSDFQNYFKPDDEKQLAELMQGLINRSDGFKWDYQQEIVNFASSFIGSMRKIIRDL